MTGCKFSARNYRNLDPIKNKSKASYDQNVNILPDVKLLKNAANNQQVGSLVGSKLLTSVKDLRKSIKNLMAIYDEKGPSIDTKAKKPECLSSQEKVRPRRVNVSKSNRQNLDCRKLTTNKPASLNDHKYLDLKFEPIVPFKAKCNSPRISNKSAQLFNAKQNNIVRLLDQNLNDDLLLKMGIRHTSKFGNSSMRNSKSVYDYGCNEEVKQCSLLKYSISFPISIEGEAQQQPGYEVNQARFKNRKRKGSFYKEIALVPVESSDAAKLAAKKALNKQSNPVECSICGEFMKNEKGVKLHISKKQDQFSTIETNRYSVQSEFQPSPNKPIYKTRSISFDFSNKDLESLVIAKALVVQDFTPSPYDTNSLCLRDGDVIDVVDMNETGIWTGILNKKFGKFKFIYVKIIESKNINLKTSLEPLASSIIESCVPGSLTINNLRSYKSSAAYGLNLETKKINTSSNYNQKKFKSLSYGYLNSICNRLNENKRGATNRSGSVPVYTCLDKQNINFSQIYSTSVTQLILL
ncbi:SAM domain-containing SAMSN-1-like isoform X1 [Brachionus plicatilis]|uniref:SAM domain-containing SAMSN-1-like isoform X1 n=1 Tax=Brachionus plicatilis TaxID=10195 RepID=A0A3M7SDK5_BRAPC|nr:SAM domain-containing SAMSN-1-like isoform X1 [Brachionus plicatilis]